MGDADLDEVDNIVACASLLKLFLREIYEQSTVEFETAKNALVLAFAHYDIQQSEPDQS